MKYGWLLPALLGLTGCTGQFVPTQTVDKVGLAVMQRAGEIEIVTPEEAAGMETLGAIEGHSCKNQVMVGEADSTKVGAIDQLRIVAAQKGADAITTPMCEEGSVSLIKNCWNSWECHSLAVRKRED